jgi:hypothetical protein
MNRVEIPVTAASYDYSGSLIRGLVSIKGGRWDIWPIKRHSDGSFINTRAFLVNNQKLHFLSVF